MTKKLLTFLTLLTLFFGVGWAAEVTFQVGTDASNTTTITKDGISISLSGGTWSRTDNYRLYSGETMTFSSEVGNIVNIAITCTGDGYSANGPSKLSGTGYSYQLSSNIGLWQGTPATSVTLSASAQVRMTRIVVTTETGGSTTTYSLTGTGDNGTVTFSVGGSAVTSAAADATVTATATANTGYQFSSWTQPSNVTNWSTNGSTATFTMPSAPVTVSATFTESSSGGDEHTATLTNANIVDAGAGTTGYSDWEMTDENGKTWNAHAIKNQHSNATSAYHFLQIRGYNSSGPYYIQVPEYGVKITKLEMTVSSTQTTMTGGGNTATLFFSSSNTTSSSGTGVASGTGSSKVTIDCSNLNLNTGYITASAGVRIWDVVVTYEEEVAGAYSIETVCTPTVGGTINCVGSANANAQVTVTFTPNPGYELSTLTVDGNDVTSGVSNNSYTFSMPAHNVTITATFALAKNKVEFTVAPANTGEVWLTSGTTYDEGLGYSYSTMGTVVGVALAAYPGYDVNSLTITDATGATVSYTTYNSEWNDGKWVTYYTFVMPATAVNIAATFKSGDIYILGTANDNPWNGNKGVKMTYDAGTNTYSANVYFATTTNTGKGQFSFASNLSGNDGDENGNGSWNNIGKRWGAPSQDYDLVTNANGGNWTENNSDPNRFAVPYGVYEIKVNWGTGLVTATKKDITVTLDKAAGQLETGTTVNVASNLTSLLSACKSGVSATLAYSTDDGANYTDGSSFAVNSAMTAKGKAYYGTIEAESDSYAYTVVTHYAVTATANPAKGGTVSVSPTSALAGETVTVTASPKSGYELTSITVNGDEIDITNTPYTFEMPAQATAVIANFTAKTLNLTINNDNSKGTVYGVPATSTVSSGISFTVTPKEGYTVNTVTYSFTPDGGAENTTTLTAPYSFNMPGYDVTINITYNEQSSGGGDGEATDLYHESFGNNSSSVRDWDDSYSVKTGVEAVYSGITGYTVENVGQSKNTVGYIESGLAQRSQNSDASIIIGPLNVANYTDLILSYYWKAASVGATYYTKLYYATSATGTYTEVEGTGAGATTFVERSYNLPEAAQVSTLYLKIIYRTSNSQAVIDEVNLSGVPNAVSDPVFTPAQGLYGIDVDVTISCPTSGATIYYTTDNSDPKTSTTRKEYTGEIVVSQTTTFKAYAEKDGMSSDVVTATYTINKNTEIETVTLDYIEPFTGSDGIGKFTINNESGYSPVWSLDGNYGVKGTAYNPNTTPTNNAAVSRLVSPIIDMTDANIPELTFSHQINSFFNDPSTQCTVWIRETTDGTSGTWNQLPVTVTVPASGSWSNDFARIDLSGYAGKKVQISFLYSNPTEGSGAGTWEIQNFRVTDNSDIVVVNNIAEFMDEEVTQGTIARFRNPVVVLYHYQQYYDDEQGDYSNDYIWVKDNSGYAIIYGHYLDVEYENGDVIPAGFTATKNYYSVGQFYQMFEPEGLQPSTEKALADPEAVTLAMLNSNKEAYNGHYVTISKMQIQFSQGQLVAYTSGTSGQRNFSVGDETIAIANNQSGNSGSIIGYNNFDNPWLETLDYPEFENITTVYGDFNITGIFEQYNGKWEFMPIIITPWEPNKVTLHDLCEKGTVNETYTISNRLQCVYIQGNKLWVKDDNGQSILKKAPAEGDNNYEIGESSGNTQLNQSLYDQSNWLEVHLADGSANAETFYRHIIKGGAITGKFTNKTNPTMENVVLTSTALENSNEIGGTVEYAPNYYCAANFYNGIEGGNQACMGSENHGNFFFMNPKPQEYAQIVWAQWDGTKMIVPTGEGANEHRFNGEFEVNMSMNSYPNFSPTTGKAYKFEAIVRRIESTGGNTLRANKSNDYIVYPLTLSDDVVTGINNVTGKAVAGRKYYNLAGMESDRPFEGVNIIVTTYTDGSRSSAKVLK